MSNDLSSHVDMTARRRQLSKVNQKKYRTSKKATNLRLALDVAVLHDQISSLEQALHRRRRWGAQEATVLEYFRLFATGYDQSERQDAFFRLFFSPDVRFDDHEIGIQPIVATWRAGQDLFGSIQVECTSSTVVSHDVAEGGDEGVEMAIVEAWVACQLELDWKTVNALVPQPRHDLAQNMVGSRVEMMVRAVFVFNEDVQVARVTSDLNLVQTLHSRFGNLDDVFAVTEPLRRLKGLKFPTAPKR